MTTAGEAPPEGLLVEPPAFPVGDPAMTVVSTRVFGIVLGGEDDSSVDGGDEGLEFDSLPDEEVVEEEEEGPGEELDGAEEEDGLGEELGIELLGGAELLGGGELVEEEELLGGAELDIAGRMLKKPD